MRDQSSTYVFTICLFIFYTRHFTNLSFLYIYIFLSTESGSGSLPGSLSGSSSVNPDSSLSASPSAGTTKPNQAGSAASNTDQISSGSKGSGSTVFTVVGLLAGIIIVAALLFALYSRKKKREQEAAGGFGRSDSVDEGVVPGGPETPKQNIVIM